MGLAVKIANTLQARGLTNQEFAYLMGKKASEVSHWLSGTHNFTTETLWQMERVLRVQLLTIRGKRRQRTRRIERLYSQRSAKSNYKIYES
jgi:transcriptional regulator with XRE-family HTH domain